MKESQRVLKQLQKYAPILGGKDAKGNVHDFGDEADMQQRKHLFWVETLEEPEDNHNYMGTFMLGNVIIGKIKDDAYKIEYLGLARDYIPLDSDRQPQTDEQKAMRKKVLVCLQKEKYQSEVGKRNKFARNGSFDLDPLPPEEDFQYIPEPKSQETKQLEDVK